MRLQKSHYIRLWYIAGLSSLSSPIDLVEEFVNDELSNLREFPSSPIKPMVEERLKMLLQPIEIICPIDKHIFNGLRTVHRELVTLFAKCKESNKCIEITKVMEKSFGLFRTLPSANDFVDRFQTSENLHSLIDLLIRHPDIPLRNRVLFQFQSIFLIGYVDKTTQNHNFFQLDSAVKDALHSIQKCLESGKQNGDTVQKYSKECEIEMSGIFSICDGLLPKTTKDKEKESQRRAHISETKTQRADFWAKVKKDIYELKNSENIKYRSDACRRYYKRHKELFKKDDGKYYSIGTVIDRCCKNDAPNMKRSIYNSGIPIQTSFADKELIDFGKKYAEWHKSQENQYETRHETTEDQSTQSRSNGSR